MNQVDETSATLVVDRENTQNLIQQNEVHVTKENLSYVISKRVFDILFSIMALLVLGVGIVLIYVFLKLNDPKGKVFFSQSRFGLNSKRFKMFKFRSMVSDAEFKLKNNALLYEKYLMNNYKLDPEEDPRMTTFGRMLRKYSIDEIPQFYNVLKGQMSIVGPRPIVDEELYKEYGKDSLLFLSVKPGITGYWQANGRSNIGYPERKAMELFYIKNKSFKLDMLIIVKTVKSILLKEGAY